MSQYRITGGAGVEMGTYEGDTREAAYRAMIEDAGAMCERVQALSDESGQAGDLGMVAVCDRALGGDSEAIAACVGVMLAAQDADADGGVRVTEIPVSEWIEQ